MVNMEIILSQYLTGRFITGDITDLSLQICPLESPKAEQSTQPVLSLGRCTFCLKIKNIENSIKLVFIPLFMLLYSVLTVSCTSSTE